MSPPSLPAQLLLTTFKYIYFHGKLGCLENEYLLKNPIVIYDSKLFEES